MQEEKDPVAVESGRRLAEARKELRLTQEAVAKAAGGISASRLANYEQGLRRIRLEEAEILAPILNRTAAFLMATVDEAEDAVLSAYRRRLAQRPAVRPARPAKRRT